MYICNQIFVAGKVSQLQLINIEGWNFEHKTCEIQMMRILIACRQLDYCSALEFFLQNKSDHEVVGMATDNPTMLTLAQAAQPDILLLDWNLSDQPLAALNQVKQQDDIQPGVILIFVPYGAEQNALASSADALVLEGAPVKKLLIAIETIRINRREG